MRDIESIGRADGLALVWEASDRVRSWRPGFGIRPKSVSRFHRVVGSIMAALGSADYRDELWTTLWRRSYWPTSRPPFRVEDAAVVWHEGWHARWTGSPLLFLPYAMLYLAPASLAPLALLLPGWWPLLGLALLLPLPAPFRLWSETRGYACQMAFHRGLGWWDGASFEELDAAYYDQFGHFFAGMAYYSPVGRPIARWMIRRSLRRLMAGRLTRYEQDAERHGIDSRRTGP